MRRFVYDRLDTMKPEWRNRKSNSGKNARKLVVALCVVAVVAAGFAFFLINHQSKSGVAGATPGFTAGSTPGYIPSSSASTTRVVVIVGDSVTSCSPMGGCNFSNYGRELANLNHWKLSELAIAGTGFLQGDQTVPPTHFATRISRAAALKPSYVIFQGGRSDVGKPTAKITAAVSSDMLRIKKVLPKAKLIVVGPISLSPVPASVVATRDAIRAATDNRALFIDPIGLGWYKGEFASLIGSDGIHPNDAGEIYLAKQIQGVLRTVGLAN
jgi:lysophospholipase L1-like esterase